MAHDFALGAPPRPADTAVLALPSWSDATAWADAAPAWLPWAVTGLFAVVALVALVGRRRARRHERFTAGRLKQAWAALQDTEATLKSTEATLAQEREWAQEQVRAVEPALAVGQALAVERALAAERAHAVERAHAAGLWPQLDDEAVEELLSLADLVTSDEAALQLRRVLAAVGIRELPVQAGDPFDPDLHVVCHARPAPAPEYLGTVATVHASGWATSTDVLRLADVELYVDPR